MSGSATAERNDLRRFRKNVRMYARYGGRSPPPREEPNLGGWEGVAGIGLVTFVGAGFGYTVANLLAQFALPFGTTALLALLAAYVGGWFLGAPFADTVLGIDRVAESVGVSES